MAKLSDFKSAGDSANLKAIDGKSFTIVGVEESAYQDGDNEVPGVKILTKENFTVDGRDYNKLHTTRVAVVNKLLSAPIREALNGGETFEVKCVESKTKRGNPVFVLEDA